MIPCEPPGEPIQRIGKCTLADGTRVVKYEGYPHYYECHENAVKYKAVFQWFQCEEKT